MVYTDGGYKPAEDPANEKAGFGWSAHRNPTGPSTSVGEMVEYGFGPVTVNPADRQYVGVDSLSANSAEVSAMSQLLLRVLQWKERGDTLTNLAICYDSNYAASWGSTDDMLDTHVEAGILLQGLRRAVEQEGVNVHFIKVKGHMDDHKGFIDKFRCAKGNRLADDYATKGMKEETTQMPYKMQELPLHISGETTTR